MRNLYLLLMAMMASPLLHAEGDLTRFDGVLQTCAQVGGITFGQGGRWADCHVTRGRWFATLDNIDLYQVQYCLGGKAETCDRRALVIFGNRAYTEEARAMLVLLDDRETAYEDPLLVASGEESVMALSTLKPDGVELKRYFVWRTRQWLPIDAQGWLQELHARLPSGLSVRQTPWPDLETMHASLALFRSDDVDCCPSGGLVSVEFGVTGDSFTIMQFDVVAAAETP